MKRLLLGVLLLGGSAGAQNCPTLRPGSDDALVASPANHTVLFEDADVRVLDVHSQPHTREAVHTHRLPSVMYILQQGAGTYDTPDGTDHRSHPTDPNFKPLFRAIKPEGPHWTENTGDVPFHAIRVEFKHPGCGLGASKPASPGPDDALLAAPGSNALLFENDELRVLDVHLPPGAKDAFHTYPWPGSSMSFSRRRRDVWAKREGQRCFRSRPAQRLCLSRQRATLSKIPATSRCTSSGLS